MTSVISVPSMASMPGAGRVHRMQTPVSTRYVKRRDFTDIAVLLGYSMREVEVDYEDLMDPLRGRPEVLLGYRVYLVTPDTVVRTARGLAVASVVLTGNAPRHPRYAEAMDVLFFAQMSWPGWPRPGRVAA